MESPKNFFHSGASANNHTTLGNLIAPFFSLHSIGWSPQGQTSTDKKANL
jgi:hypothetical protein